LSLFSRVKAELHDDKFKDILN